LESETQNLQYPKSSCFPGNENMTMKQIISIQRYIKPNWRSSSNNELKQKFNIRIQLLRFNNKMVVINIEAKFKKKKKKKTLLRMIQTSLMNLLPYGVLVSPHLFSWHPSTSGTYNNINYHRFFFYLDNSNNSVHLNYCTLPHSFPTISSYLLRLIKRYSSATNSCYSKSWVFTSLTGN
jgi:hypothetical protein